MTRRCAGPAAPAPGGHRQRVRRGVEIKLPDGSRGEHGMHVLPLPVTPKLCFWAPCFVFTLFMGALWSRKAASARSAVLPGAYIGAALAGKRRLRLSPPELQLLLGRCRGGTPVAPQLLCSPWLPGHVPVLLF